MKTTRDKFTNTLRLRAPHALRPGAASIGTLALVLGTLTALPRADAATIDVNTHDDVVAVDGACSLREAISAVNSATASGNLAGECPAGDGDDDTIMLHTGPYALTIVGAPEDLNAQGDLDVHASVTIIGAGLSDTAIDASALSSNSFPDRVLHVIGPSIHVTLQDLTIRGGHAPDAASTFTAGASGGGIYADHAMLTLQRVALSGNVSGRGGDAPTFGGAGKGGAGGGLYAITSTVIISDSLFTMNHSGAGGDAQNANSFAGLGGMGGALALSNSMLTLQRTVLSANASGAGGMNSSGSRVFSGAGGALHMDGGSAVVTQCAVDGNASGDDADGSGDWGGGIAVISAGSLTLAQTSVTRNVARLGGGLFVYGSVQLSNVTLAGNRASSGGALYLDGTGATIDFTTISDNHAAIGGGVDTSSNALVQLRNSIVSGNSGGADCGADTGVTPNYVSGGYNVSGSSCPSNGSGDVATTNPQLGQLSANGGVGDTMLPHPRSPATDAASCLASSTSVDERSHARPADVPRVANAFDGCDSGAVELDDDIFWDDFES
jgi:CSLREA domain-containing protein